MGSIQRFLVLPPSVGVHPTEVAVEPLDQAIIEIHEVAHFIFSFNGKRMGRISKL